MPEQASQNQATSPTRFTSQGGTVMQYRTLGRTGVQVSTLVLGAMNFGDGPDVHDATAPPMRAWECHGHPGQSQRRYR
jgi:hypothetical protein